MALKPVVSALRMVPVVENVNIPFHAQFLKDGALEANETMTEAADDELVRVEAALRPLRRADRRAA